MTNKPPNNLSGLSGAGGGKSAPTEAADNRFSDVIAKILIAYSYGTTDGLLNGRKSIFLDETQLQTNNGSDNFSGVTFTESDGTGIVAGDTGGLNKGASIGGFSTATSVISIGVDVVKATPVIRTVSASNVDAVRFIITIPALQNIEEDGDIKGTSVQLQYHVRDPASGLWENRGVHTIEGKSSGPFQRQYTVESPDTVTAAWDWRVTDDSSSARLSNDTSVQAAVEIFYGTEDYTGTAAIGVAIDTADFGNSIPSVSFEVGGVKVKVPSNYTVTNGIPNYNGIWDGTFILMSTSNPVWHLYHLLTNDEAGLGLPASFIDRYNFYDVARYNDAVNSSGTFVGVDDGANGVRRRFTINTQIRGQQDGIKMCQEIASCMRAILYFGAGAIILKQDAPRDTARIVTNENVKNGQFAYSSTQAKDRITVAKVSYNDPNDFFKLKYTVYPALANWATDPLIARYGRNELDVTKFGCASEAESFAFAKWIVYASCNENRTVTFVGDMEFLLTRPGDIIEIADRRLGGAASFDQRMGGRIAGSTTTTVALDYPVTLAAGETYQITVIGVDGVTLEKRDITTSAGDVSSVTVSSAFTNAPTVGFTWLITGTDIAPQKFSVINIERKEGLEVEVFALNHVEAKYSVVETGTTVIATPYTRIDTAVVPPTAMTFQLVARNDETTLTSNSLLVRWTASDSEYATRYEVYYKKDLGNLISTPLTNLNEIEILDVSKGQYDIVVYAVNPLGIKSVALTGTYTVAYATGNPEWQGITLTIQAPAITTAATFGGKDLEVEWTRNAANDIPGIVFKDYEVEFYVGASLKKTITTTALKATYYYDDMIADQGANPSRVIDVKIRERDSLHRIGADATRTFSNPTPTAPAFALNPGFSTMYINITPTSDLDLVGYYVFRGTTTGFTPNLASVIYKGSSPSYTDSALTVGDTYFYRVAAYDLFDDSIATVTISGELSDAPLTVEGTIVSFSFEGLEFSESANVVTWTSGTVYEQADTTVTTTTITGGNDTWTSGTLYFFWDPVAAIIDSSTNLANVYQNGETRRIVATYDGTVLREGTNKPIFDGADIIAGTIGATQVVTSGLITNTAQIANAVIESANILDATITGAKILDATITSAKIGNAEITGAKIANAEIDTLQLKNGSVSEITLYSDSGTSTTNVSGGAGSSGGGSRIVHLNHVVPNPSGVTGPFKSYLQPTIEIVKNSSIECTIELVGKLYKDNVVIDTRYFSLNTNGLYTLGLFSFNFLGVAGSTYGATIEYNFVLRQTGTVSFSAGNSSSIGITILK